MWEGVIAQHRIQIYYYAIPALNIDTDHAPYPIGAHRRAPLPCDPHRRVPTSFGRPQTLHPPTLPPTTNVVQYEQIDCQ